MQFLKPKKTRDDATIQLYYETGAHAGLVRVPYDLIAEIGVIRYRGRIYRYSTRNEFVEAQFLDLDRLETTLVA